jgi:tellurite resistance protein
MSEGESYEVPPRGDSRDDEGAVRRELSRIRRFVKDLSLDDLRDGDWFAKLLTFSLGKYVRDVDAEYLRAKYPGLPADAVVQARIQLAARYASIGGGLTAAAYTGAVAATIGSGGGASPLALPAGAAGFVVDLTYTTQLQLRLAYDISALYRVPLDMNDPEDLWKLIRVAFAIKAGEASQGFALKMVPAIMRPLMKKIFTGSTLHAVKSLPVVGKYLLQRNIIKFSIPGVGIPLSIGMNYWITRVAGTHALNAFRTEAAIGEAARRMTERSTHHSELLWVLWLVIQADGVIHENERLLLAHVTTLVGDLDVELEALAELRDTIELDQDKVWSTLAAAAGDLGAIYDAGVTAAAIDGKIHAKELAVLTRLSEYCSAEYDEQMIRSAAKGA